MVLVEPALAHQNWQHRKAAYLAMAVITEGCADYIATKLVTHLFTLLPLFLSHISRCECVGLGLKNYKTKTVF